MCPCKFSRSRSPTRSRVSNVLRSAAKSWRNVARNVVVRAQVHGQCEAALRPAESQSRPPDDRRDHAHQLCRRGRGGQQGAMLLLHHRSWYVPRAQRVDMHLFSTFSFDDDPRSNLVHVFPQLLQITKPTDSVVQTRFSPSQGLRGYDSPSQSPLVLFSN